MTQAEITTRKVYLTNIDGSTAARLAAFYATINDAIVGLAEDYRLSREEACRLVARWLERNAPDDSDETSTAEAEDEDAA